jgi:hypothetical protein
MAIGLCILGIMISNIYPLFKAAQIVTPSLRRKWTLDIKPVGDTWSIPLPFTVSEELEARGVLQFIKEYISGYPVEETGAPFAAREVVYREGVDEAGRFKAVDCYVHVAPFSAGIHQQVRIMMTQDPRTKAWNMGLYIERKEGMYNTWVQVNFKFIDTIRKQFLIWRSLSLSERRTYMGMT